MKNGLLVFSGNSNRKLAQGICKSLNIHPGKASVAKFSDGEIRVKIQENVRGHDVFVVQSTCFPSNDNLMELLIMMDALRRASAQRITAVLPYFGYARQDRKDQPRVPITAKLVANILAATGAHRVLTIDLHAGQIQGFFDIPLDHLFAADLFVNHIRSLKLRPMVVVSPDVGGIKTARSYAKRLRAPLAIVDKRRVDDKKAEVMHILGEVKGRNAILVDDMVATAGSLVEAVDALKNAGANDVYAAVTHPVLCGPALDRLRRSPLKQLFVTDTIPLDEHKKLSKIKAISVARVLADAIRRIHSEQSISVLFSKIF
ncbi:ribose-phosphate diphosphokinase [Candidatus Omnitrophota bacterium]